MRVVRFFLAALCLAAGAAVGALNRSAVAIDLGAVELHSTLGVALIVSLLAGAFVGGAAVAFGSSRSGRDYIHEGRDASRSEV